MKRVVVVGNGMVGSRFVDELVERAADAAVEITVLGAEEYEPYNRVLLSEVVAGKIDVASLTLPRRDDGAVGPGTGGTPARPGGDGAPRVRVRSGTTATEIDLDRREVVDTAGQRHAYDTLVLATGARARIPAIAALDEARTWPAGVHALRTLDDAREIVAATVNARTAVVLGAGVLGLEVACGLRRRGLRVTVVHGGPHLMDRQLSAEAASAVAHGLDRMGVEHRVAAVTEEVLLTERTLRGVRLTSVAGPGESLPADLLVLTVGTVPEAGLAERAGLAVRRGIVVDARGATADPRVFAIGDCAEPPEGSTGLIAQGWDQARRLATRLADQLIAAPAETGSAPAQPAPAQAGAVRGTGDALHGTDVVRLKAYGLDVVAMGGGGGPFVAGRRRVRLSDPDVGRHVEVIVQDGVVVGATCVGAGAVGTDLATAYSRQTPAPKDPAQLLLRPVRGAGAEGVAEPSPTLMPDRATVCRCNGVTKGDIVTCWRHGARSVDDVSRATRATTGCGGCTEAVCGIVDWLKRSDPPAPVDAPTPGEQPDRAPSHGGAEVTGAPAVHPGTSAEQPAQAGAFSR